MSGGLYAPRRPVVLVHGDDIFARRHAVWDAGGVAIQPLPTPGFESLWFTDVLELVREVKAVCLPDVWRHFARSVAIAAEARRQGVPCFVSVDAVCSWLIGGAR